MNYKSSLDEDILVYFMDLCGVDIDEKGVHLAVKSVIISMF